MTRLPGDYNRQPGQGTTGLFAGGLELEHESTRLGGAIKTGLHSLSLRMGPAHLFF